MPLTNQVREVAVSWSLRNHYSDDLTLMGRVGLRREGHALRGVLVYDSAALHYYGFSEHLISKPRAMCKRRERLNGQRPR